ncbi:MAG TPA: response regulator [Vicinamibacterales bacterium]|nr:response regulator [Vicinamibacterales bacterium]
MKGPDATRIRVVIVDDEPLARGLLREWLATHDEIEIVAECANGFEAVKAATELKPDLMMLDVQMPKLDGFDVLELVGVDIPVIFITAYDSYAVRAFEVHAVDYLLKPFSAERLSEALDRARLRIRAKDRPPVTDLITATRRDRTPLQRILIRERAEVHVIPVAKIDYLESQDDYVAVKCGGRSYLKEQPLGDLEGQLDPSAFVRIHRRYVLNLARLARIEMGVTDSRVAVLNDGTQLPISRTGYAKLKELL